MDPFRYLCFVFVSHTVLSLLCSCVVMCWERALFYVLFSCVFVTFQYDVLGQVWYLIVSIPDLRLLPYYKNEIRIGHIQHEKDYRLEILQYLSGL